MKPRQVRYGLLCNEKGGIKDDVLVYRLEAFWLMVVNASNREKILKWIADNKGTYDVQVVDETAAWGMVAIQGPDAHKVVAVVAPPALDLRYYFGTTAMTEPGQLRIWSRTGYTGEDGWEVIVPTAELPALVERLMGPVAKETDVKLVPCGLGARDTLRLEAGMPLYGHELSEDIDPFQAGLGWAVKLNKGPFLGRAGLEQHHASAGRRPQRVGLELEGKRIAREGAEVRSGDKVVGQVTSGTFSPTLQKAIAMAYLDPAATALDTACEVDIRGKAVPARVVALPFYERPKK
jgi:aminomethyltransferase